MKIYIVWKSKVCGRSLVTCPFAATLLTLVLLAFSVQGCLGSGANNSSSPNTKTITTNSNGQQIGINQNQNLFKGKIYSTIDGHLWVYNGDGTIRQLTNSLNLHNPAVSPDGSRLAFVSNRDGQYEIYVAAIDGSNPVNVSRHALRDTYPTWTPDGGSVTFVSERTIKASAWGKTSSRAGRLVPSTSIKSACSERWARAAG